jgi:hypothetical protein
MDDDQNRRQPIASCDIDVLGNGSIIQAGCRISMFKQQHMARWAVELPSPVVSAKAEHVRFLYRYIRTPNLWFCCVSCKMLVASSDLNHLFLRNLLKIEIFENRHPGKSALESPSPEGQ